MKVNPLLPAVANRFQPALAVMQSISAMNARVARTDTSAPATGMPVAAKAPVKDIAAVNEYYFGSHLTPTELMFSMMEKVVGYLNEKLDAGRDGAQPEVDAANKWRRTALRDDIKVGSERDFSIPVPGEEGFSFRRVAQFIKDKFNVGVLSQDHQLVKMLEQLVGFRLDGMSVDDLLQSFIDPGGKEAERVREVLSEGLAGETGSKASQRLEDAAEGAKSVAEAVDAAVNKKQTDEVDEETQAEDIKAIRAAKAREALEKAAELPEKVEKAAKAAEAKATSGADKADEADVDGAAAAAAIQALTSIVETDDTDTAPDIGSDEAQPSGATDGAAAMSAEPKDADEIEASAGASERARNTLNAVLKEYLEALGQVADEDEEPAFSMMI